MTNNTMKNFNASEHTVHLKDMICLKRHYGGALTVEDFPSKTQFTSWKNSLRILQDTVTLHGSLVRNASAEAEVATSRSSMFEAYRHVLSFFEEPNFKLRPEKDDEAALMTIAYRLIARHSDAYKEASASKREATKRMAEYRTANKLYDDDAIKAASQAVKEGLKKVEDAYDEAVKEFEAVKEKADATTKEAVPYSEENFRKAFENMVCDRIEKRLAMTSEQIREEKKAANKKRADRRKAAKASK